MLAGLLLYELHCTLMELRHRRRDDVLDATVQVRQASWLGSMQLILTKWHFSSYLTVKTVSITKTDRLMLYRKIISVWSEKRAKHTKLLCGANAGLVHVKVGEKYKVFILSDKYGSPLPETIPKRLSAEGHVSTPSKMTREKRLSDKIMILSVVTHIGKAIPLQVWTGPEGSRRLRLPDYKTIGHEGGRVVSHTRRPPLPSGNIPGNGFCSRLSQHQGHSAAGKITSMKNSNDISNRTRDLPACRTVPQPPVPPRTPFLHYICQMTLRHIPGECNIDVERRKVL